MSKPLIFGEISDVLIGDVFANRKDVMQKGLHRSNQAGIDGNRNEGAAAIVLSAGYEDDIDLGYQIIYTGAGGQDPNSKKQIGHQSFDSGPNAAMLKSMNENLPIRVIRGHQHKSKLSPASGYAYGGLYKITDAYYDTGKGGFRVCRFNLEFSEDNWSQMQQFENQELDHGIRIQRRQEVLSHKIVRDHKLASTVKMLYNHQCQICGEALKVKGGFYAEAAHIKALGHPHNGDDSLTNLLCLCPNHHVMFDRGTIQIEEDLSIKGANFKKLYLHPNHNISLQNFAYHRMVHGDITKLP